MTTNRIWLPDVKTTQHVVCLKSGSLDINMALWGWGTQIASSGAKEQKKKIKMSEQMDDVIMESTGEPTSPNSIQSVSDSFEKKNWMIKKRTPPRELDIANTAMEQYIDTS